MDLAGLNPSALWRDFGGASAIAVLAACLSAAPAQSAVRAGGFPPAFVVADVGVDASAESGVAARKKARADGEAAALGILLHRLTNPADWSRLPAPTPSDAANLVVAMTVDDEHASPRRYLGRYTFRFSPVGVRRLIHGAGLDLMELMSKPIILIPLYQTKDATALWDDPNPWREAWNRAFSRAGLVPWIVPEGDVEDVQTLDAAAAVAQNPPADKLASLAQRYGGGDAVIATAVESDQAAGTTLQITVTRYPTAGPADAGTPDGGAPNPAPSSPAPSSPAPSSLEPANPNPGNAPAKGATALSATASVTAPKADRGLYIAGVEAAEQALETLWKQQQLGTAGGGAAGTVAAAGTASSGGGSGPGATPAPTLPPLPEGSVGAVPVGATPGQMAGQSAAAPATGDAGAMAPMSDAAVGRPTLVEAMIDGARGWASLKNRLSQISAVAGIKILSISHGAVRLELDLTGPPDALPLAFAQQDLVLRGSGNVLSLAQRNPGTVAP